MAQHELIIKDACIFDGSGGDSYHADIGIRDGVIAEIGSISSSGLRQYDAQGAMVTPGFVDIHTHYDGQATWSNRMSPSSHHGVTTAVMGNCGVGFAPVRSQDQNRLIELMEGVEDIPGAALHEGLSWQWESFADYMDFLSQRRFDMDLGAQVPHCALRVYVMGERGANREIATAQDIAAMRKHCCAAIKAGALGFSTSRTLNHRSSKGEPTPSLNALQDELVGIALGLKDAGAGVLEMISDFDDVDAEFDTFTEMVKQSGRPMSISLAQGRNPEGWRVILDKIAKASSNGNKMRGQVAPRAIGVILGLTATLNPFSMHPSYQAIAKLPLDERLHILRQADFKAKLIDETPSENYRRVKHLIGRFDKMWPLDAQPNYEPLPEHSIANAAKTDNALSYVYDLLLANQGKQLLYVPFANYSNFNLDCCRDMLLDDNTVVGLGDGGAHVGTICDASFSTYLLTHWGRDRSRGEGLPLPFLVKNQTRDTALTVGLQDRGLIATGMKADINVIDFANLKIHGPEIINDLPAGGARFQQRASGYLATVVNGEITYQNGEATEALPGRLIRGAKNHPANNKKQ